MNFLNARQSGAAEPSPKAQNKQLSKRRKAAEDDERISRFFGSTVNYYLGLRVPIWYNRA